MMNSVEAYTLMHQGSLAFARAEQAGIRVDMEYIESKLKHMARQMDYLDRKFRESKFYEHWQKSQDKEPNPNSTVQLATFLYDVKGLKPPKETTTGRGSVGKESLQALNIPEMNMILEIRKLKKIRDYLESFKREQVNGWMHPSFNLHLVTTYRSSSDHPNFQNIPKRDKEAMKITRGALYPRKGHQLLEVDYGQLEVRIAACYNQDKKLIHDILKGDMHADMMEQIFFLKYDKSIPGHVYLRSAAKNGFVFPEFYGDYFGNCAVYLAKDWGKLPLGKWKPGQGVPVGDEFLSDHLSKQYITNEKGKKTYITSIDVFEKHLKEIEQDFWGNKYKRYARWKERWWRQYQKNGYVDLLTGFRCKGVMSKNDATNYPIQGAAFHCLLWSFIEIDRFLRQMKWRTRIIGQIHDAIIFDVYPPELPMLVEHTRRITCEELPKAWKWINVPLTVDYEICDVDASWADKKDLEKSI